MRVLPGVSLTDNQKRVLAKISASPTPKVAGEEVSGDQNLVGARDQLAHLGAIEFVAGEATITDKGMQLAKDANLVDDSGQLTPDGEALAYTSTTGKEDKDKTKQPPTTPPPGAPGMGLGGPPPAPGAGAGLDLTMSFVPVSFKQFLENEKIEDKKPKTPRKPSTPEQRMKGRARHWKKTGVSDSTVKWMRDHGML